MNCYSANILNIFYSSEFLSLIVHILRHIFTQVIRKTFRLLYNYCKYGLELYQYLKVILLIEKYMHFNYERVL